MQYHAPTVTLGRRHCGYGLGLEGLESSRFTRLVRSSGLPSAAPASTALRTATVPLLWSTSVKETSRPSPSERHLSLPRSRDERRFVFDIEQARVVFPTAHIGLPVSVIECNTTFGLSTNSGDNWCGVGRGRAVIVMSGGFPDGHSVFTLASDRYSQLGCRLKGTCTPQSENDDGQCKQDLSSSRGHQQIPRVCELACACLE